MISGIQKITTVVLITLLIVLLTQCSWVKQPLIRSEVSSEITEVLIKPSATDSLITTTDVAHLIMYDSQIKRSKLLLFLPGTNGVPDRGPKELFEFAIQQGYKVINLSYINQPAVARICKGDNLDKDINCTEKFRTQRVFGTQLTSLIPDEPQDGIINRFTKLLLYLKENDKKGNWDLYLNGNTPNWDIITVAGQSQGGGMAAFIAKKKRVNRIITFSGGWDFSKDNEIAQWYSSKSITPENRWFGIYHSKEPRAETIAKTYKAMAIPEKHIFPLDLEIREGKKAHGEGIRNIAYKEAWARLFEKGTIHNSK